MIALMLQFIGAVFVAVMITVGIYSSLVETRNNSKRRKK
ncbi:putative membrane protein [Ochrobactrum sp. P20RRXII]|nr:putative membrane protein [Ochrobactrum sp. P20RRXII]